MRRLLGVGVLLLVLAPAAHGAPGVGRGDVEPRVITVQQAHLERDADLRALIEAVQRDVDAFIVLCGGPSSQSDVTATATALRAMVDALGALAAERRIAVGDSGIRGGIMEAAGQARLASGGAFPLIGVAPAGAIPPAGTTPIDPNHSHIVAVHDPVLPANDAGWGSERATKYWLFGRLGHGRASVAIVANGGGLTLDEVAANVEVGRPTILIEGSGGAADAVIALLRGAAPVDGGGALLQQKARALGLARRPALFHVVPIAGGAAGLLEALRTALGTVLPRTP
jgi:hypothetical protein